MYWKEQAVILLAPFLRVGTSITSPLSWGAEPHTIALFLALSLLCCTTRVVLFCRNSWPIRHHRRRPVNCGGDCARRQAFVSHQRTYTRYKTHTRVYACVYIHRLRVLMKVNEWGMGGGGVGFLRKIVVFHVKIN